MWDVSHSLSHRMPHCRGGKVNNIGKVLVALGEFVKAMQVFSPKTTLSEAKRSVQYAPIATSRR